MRPHRLATLCVMNRHDLIKNNEVSFQFTIDDCPYYVENVLDEERKLKYEKDFQRRKLLSEKAKQRAAQKKCQNAD